MRSPDGILGTGLVQKAPNNKESPLSSVSSLASIRSVVGELFRRTKWIAAWTRLSERVGQNNRRIIKVSTSHMTLTSRYLYMTHDYKQRLAGRATYSTLWSIDRGRRSHVSRRPRCHFGFARSQRCRQDHNVALSRGFTQA